jgi:hypothetical protein
MKSYLDLINYFLLCDITCFILLLIFQQKDKVRQILQADKVRKLKTSGVEKAVWQPEVNILLELKKKLALANSSIPKSENEKSASELEAAVAQQVMIKCIFKHQLIFFF